MCLVDFHKYFTIECVSNYKILYDSYWHVLSEEKNSALKQNVMYVITSLPRKTKSPVTIRKIPKIL